MQTIDPYGQGSNHPTRQLENTVMRNLLLTTEFAEAMSHPIGKEFFKTLIELLDEKFRLIYEEKATEGDRAVFRACKDLGLKWKLILDSHSENARTAHKLQMDKAVEAFEKKAAAPDVAVKKRIRKVSRKK
jgi:hypothetical protein